MRAVLSLAALVFGAACGSETGDSPTGQGEPTEPVVVDPLSGAWVGDQISFELEDHEVSAWFVKGVECTAVSENVSRPESCGEKVGEVPDVTVTVEGGVFVAELGALAVQGSFIEAGHAKGTWSFRPAECCTSNGTWEAWHHTWRGTRADPDAGTRVDGVEPDTAEPDTGATEPTDYVVPEDASPDQVEAANYVNQIRAAVGSPPIDMHGAVNQAAQAHADYYVANQSAYAVGAVPGGAHYESADVPDGYTGESFGDRMKSAGYGGSPGFEIIAFLESPKSAIDGWMETVYHRIPLVSPDAVDAGFGNGPGVAVMDFGRKTWPDKKLVLLYPFDGQTGVPKGWNGAEAPQPPPPPGGYPSGSVVTVTTAAGAPLTIDSHRLLGPGGAEVDHVWLARGSSGFLDATWAMYAHAPLTGSTTYTVEMAGKLGTAAWTRQWSFTTAP